MNVIIVKRSNKTFFFIKSKEPIELAHMQRTQISIQS